MSAGSRDDFASMRQSARTVQYVGRAGATDVSSWRRMWELVGLIGAPFVASRVADVQVAAGTELGVALVAAMVWLSVRPRVRDVRLRPRKRGMLFAIPAVGILLALASAPVGASSFRYVTVFVGSWFVWLLLVRQAFANARQPARLLLVGTSPLWSTIRRVTSSPILDVYRGEVSASPDDVIVVDPRSQLDSDVHEWLTAMQVAGRHVVNAFEVTETLTGRLAVDAVARHWSTALQPVPRRYLSVKRWLDVAAVLVLSPIIVVVSLVTAIVILIESGRPVLFVQERVGKDGEPFRMLKFRTMIQAAEKDGASFACQDDARVTRIGRFLRKYRIDEFPQFWNVLRGEMSIIGPRPEQRGFAEDFEHAIAHYQVRHAVRPGITGWAQVHQGYAAGTNETDVKLSYDLYYAKHVSVGLDAEVAARTVWTILTGSGSR